MKKDSHIFVAGGTGIIDSATVRNLTEKGFTKILTPSQKELGLCNRQAVNIFF
jgi:GDP-L-fucose synthase